MSSKGVWCPCCGRPGTVQMTIEEISEVPIFFGRPLVRRSKHIASTRSCCARRPLAGQKRRCPLSSSCGKSVDWCRICCRAGIAREWELQRRNIRRWVGRCDYVLSSPSAVVRVAEAPIGAAILYSMSCGLSDTELTDRWEILARGKGRAAVLDDVEAGVEDDEDLETDNVETDGGSGSTVRLRAWSARTRKMLGLEAFAGHPLPLIDRLHRLMRLWKATDAGKVDAFLSEALLARDPLFAELVQAVIELARREGHTDEVSLLEPHSVAPGFRCRPPSGVALAAALGNTDMSGSTIKSWPQLVRLRNLPRTFTTS
jgi:hypothetical protein